MEDEKLVEIEKKLEEHLNKENFNYKVKIEVQGPYAWIILGPKCEYKLRRINLNIDKRFSLCLMVEEMAEACQKREL